MLYLSPAITVYCCILAVVFGACTGSFLNCFAWRIVHKESVLHGRSHCDHCGHVLTAADLVPVVGYLLHKGHCKYCGAKLSVRHLVAEVLTGALFLVALLKYDVSLQMLQAVLLFSILLACAFADLEGYIIPDGFIIAGIIFRIPFFFLLPDTKNQLIDSLIGSFAVAGGLLLFVLLYEKLRKIEAMGGGDIKLLFLTGLYLGWVKNILCIFVACIFGIVFALATGKKRQDEENPKLFPWGPSIAAGGILTYLFGDAVVTAYLSLF